MKLKATQGLIAAALTLAACKTPQPANDTKLKHVFGNTWVARDKPPADCMPREEDSPEAKYVNKLIDYITSKNPDTFQGHLDRKYICVRINRMNEISAAMNPDSGTMMIYPALLRARNFDTDAAFATVVSHELAHFTMAHHMRNIPRPLPPGYDKNKEAALQARLDNYKKAKQEQSVKLTQEFVDGEDQELERAIQAVSNNQKLVQKMKSVRFPRSLSESFASFRDKPSYDSSSELLIEIDTWLGQSKMDGERIAGLIPPEDMVLIKSVLRRREVLAEKTDRSDPEQGRLYDELENYRLPITQREEQEADEVGFELYIRAGFEPKLYGQTFVSLAKARNPKLNCLQITPKSSDVPRYREGISFDRKHPDFCWRYFDLKYSEREKHAADYAKFTPKKPIVNLPELNGLREAARGK